MNSILVPVVVLAVVIGLVIITTILNSNTEIPETIELIDCEKCGNQKCTIRKTNFAVKKDMQDSRCHYMPIDRMN